MKHLEQVPHKVGSKCPTLHQTRFPAKGFAPPKEIHALPSLSQQDLLLPLLLPLPDFRRHPERSEGSLYLLLLLPLPFCLSFRAQRGTCFPRAKRAPNPNKPHSKIFSSKTSQKSHVNPPPPADQHTTPMNKGDFSPTPLA